ncbi:MAG: hypothetical protein AAAC47_14360, partial [Pararhizobium sp.]
NFSIRMIHLGFSQGLPRRALRWRDGLDYGVHGGDDDENGDPGKGVSVERACLPTSIDILR